MKTANVKYFLLILILFVGLSLFAKMTRFESEDLPANPCCDCIIVDTTASNDSCRVAYVDSHSTGNIQYGPYTTLPPGHYIAVYRLKRGNENPTIKWACDLDVFSSPGAIQQGKKGTGYFFIPYCALCICNV